MGNENEPRRLIQNNRRKLIARWHTSEGQEIRSQLIAALRDHQSIPDNFIATSFVSEYGPAPSLDLRCINLSGQNLDGVDLDGVKLQGANLARCSLKNAQLVQADLRDTLLRNTDLTGADLQGANLSGAIMEDTILEGAKLDGAYISTSTIVVGATDLPASISQAEVSPWFADSLANSEPQGGDDDD